MEEIWELLVAGVKFPNLGMVTIEVEHPVPSFDNLVAKLDEWRPSNWDTPHLLNNILRRLGWVIIFRPCWWIRLWKQGWPLLWEQLCLQ